MLFRMVPSVLLSMVAQISTFWLVEIPQQPIRISQFTGFLSYHGEKKERYRVKEHKKLCWKLMSKMSLHFVWGHHSEKQTVEGPNFAASYWETRGWRSAVAWSRWLITLVVKWISCLLIQLKLLFKPGLSFGHFSGNHRLVDLPEYWVFWKFPLSFEKILEFLDNIWENIGNLG